MEGTPERVRFKAELKAEILSAKIKELRLKRKITQEQLTKEMEGLIQEVARLCREYGTWRVDGERREEARRVREALETVCTGMRRKLNVSDPGLLVALLDAYEVTRDEGMLQEILDVVGGNLDRLPVSVESVKLLAYCWYYVEEEECLERAGVMLEKLRKEGVDVTEVERVMAVLH